MFLPKLLPTQTDSSEVLKHYTDLSTILDHQKLMRMDLFPIEPFRMERLLNRIKRTSPGSDNIPNWFFQKCSYEIVDVSVYLFNLTFQTDVVPKQWRTAIVIPIPKIPRPKSLSDYRLISVTPILSRIVDKCIVNNWIWLALPTSIVANQFACWQSNLCFGSFYA